MTLADRLQEATERLTPGPWDEEAAKPFGVDAVGLVFLRNHVTEIVAALRAGEAARLTLVAAQIELHEHDCLVLDPAISAALSQPSPSSEEAPAPQ